MNTIPGIIYRSCHASHKWNILGNNTFRLLTFYFSLKHMLHYNSQKRVCLLVIPRRSILFNDLNYRWLSFKFSYRYFIHLIDCHRIPELIGTCFHTITYRYEITLNCLFLKYFQFLNNVLRQRFKWEKHWNQSFSLPIFNKVFDVHQF